MLDGHAHDIPVIIHVDINVLVLVRNETPHTDSPIRLRFLANRCIDCLLNQPISNLSSIRPLPGVEKMLCELHRASHTVGQSRCSIHRFDRSYILAYTAAGRPNNKRVITDTRNSVGFASAYAITKYSVRLCI